MNLEGRIVNELKAERAELPLARPGPTPQIRSPWPRGLAKVAITALVVIGGAALIGTFAGNRQVAAGPNEVALGSLAVPVTGEQVTVEGVTMDVAAPGPPLLPSVELPGTEVPLDQAHPPGEASLPNDTDGPMVYVGTVAGQAVVLHDDDPPIGGMGEEVGSFISRITDGPMFCANTDGCSYATGEPQLGLGQSRSGQGPFVITATGFDLPDETAAVVVTTGDGVSRWQHPAGRAVTIRWEQAEAPQRPFTFVGVDSSGKEVFRETLE